MPSPKSQNTLPGRGVLLFVNVKALPAQTVVGTVKSEFTAPMLIRFCFFTVSWQPCGLTATNITVYEPALVYVCTGAVCVEVVPSPKSQLYVRFPGPVDVLL